MEQRDAWTGEEMSECYVRCIGLLLWLYFSPVFVLLSLGLQRFQATAQRSTEVDDQGDAGVLGASSIVDVGLPALPPGIGDCSEEKRKASRQERYQTPRTSRK